MKFCELSQHLPVMNISLVHSMRKLREGLRRLGMNDDPVDGDAVTCYREGSRTFLVYVAKRSLHKDAAEDIGLIAHEATHVAQGYFLSIGEDCPSDELYAYTVQAVTQHLCDEHFKWKKKRLASS